MASSAGLRKRGASGPAEPVPSASSSAGLVNMSAVRDLASKGRTAMVVQGEAYDFTEFLSDHPGGPEYLRKNSGKDATEEFVASHPVDIIERTLSTKQFEQMKLGAVDKGSIKSTDVAKYDVNAAAAAAGHGDDAAAPAQEKPSIEQCINIFDFEAIAKHTVPKQGWVYYSSGADDEVTLRENHSAFHRIWLRPRVMVNVKEIDMSTTLLGHKCEMPLLLSAVAMCKLGHPDGEMAWQEGAGREGIIYMIPTLSGCSFDDIVAKRAPGQPMFFQLYVNQDRAKVEKVVRKAEAAGCSALFITCDAPQLGNREKDRRVKVTHAGANVQSGKTGGKAQGTSKALTTFIDPALCWDDLPWFQSITKMDIVLKGIATAEDAVKALEMGCRGVMLSNHGGRQLDFARSAIEILPEVMETLRAHPKYDAEKFDVMIDGGVRRGTDLFKAVALGAKAVGVGRPALYAMSAFGADGVQRMIQIFKEELTMAMRLMGTPTLAHIRPEMCITDQLTSHVAPVPTDMLQLETYIAKQTAAAVAQYGVAKQEAAKVAQVVAQAAPALGTLDVASKTLSVAGPLALQGFMTTDARQVINRSAMFLVSAVAVHFIGAMQFLRGREAYEAVGEIYATLNPLVVLSEAYLYGSLASHALVGLYLTQKNKNLVVPKGKSALSIFSRARLFFTGVVLSAFTLMHLKNFRFADGVSFQPQPAAGSYDRVLEVLKPAPVAGVYALAVVMLGIHLYAGWTKAVFKFGLKGDDKPYHQPVVRLGQMASLVTTLGYLVVIVAAHLRANA